MPSANASSFRCVRWPLARVASAFSANPDVDAPKAWDYSLGTGVTIGILDSGIDVNHPDLAGKIAGSEIDETGGAGRDPLHGTGVAGTAAAVTNNATGIPGMGWNSTILDVRVIDSIERPAAKCFETCCFATSMTCTLPSPWQATNSEPSRKAPSIGCLPKPA